MLLITSREGSFVCITELRCISIDVIQLSFSIEMIGKLNTIWTDIPLMQREIGIRGSHSSAEFGERGGPHGSTGDIGGYHSFLEIGGPHGSRGATGGYQSSLEIGGPHGSREFAESGGPYGSGEIAGGPYGSLQAWRSNRSSCLTAGGGLFGSREIAGGPYGSLQTGGSHSSTVLIEGGGLYSSGGGSGGYRSTREMEIRGSFSSAEFGERGGHRAIDPAGYGQTAHAPGYMGVGLTPGAEYDGLLESPLLEGLTPFSGEFSLRIGWPSLYLLLDNHRLGFLVTCLVPFNLLQELGYLMSCDAFWPFHGLGHRMCCVWVADA